MVIESCHVVPSKLQNGYKKQTVTTRLRSATFDFVPEVSGMTTGQGTPPTPARKAMTAFQLRMVVGGAIVLSTAVFLYWYQGYRLKQYVLHRAEQFLADSDGLSLKIPSYAETHSTTVVDRDVIGRLGRSLQATTCQRVPNTTRLAAGGTVVLVTPLHGEEFALLVGDAWMMVILGSGSVEERYHCTYPRGTVLKKFTAAAGFAYPLLSDVYPDMKDEE